MAKHIIRYQLAMHGSPARACKIPSYVSDGGYFPIGDDLIGISVDDEVDSIPLAVERLTQDDLEEVMRNEIFAEARWNESPEKFNERVNAFMAKLNQ